MAGDSRVVAVLGPTNTGKTTYAIERMLAHRTGVIGLPLRLLAREVYDRIVALRGPSIVALVTGEERIVPPRTQYWVCTVEAMPPETNAAFVAIDEVQIAGDGKGHVVHLFERDCTLQRRHQKVWEEANSPALNARQRNEIGEICANAIAEMGYRGAGTIEFLYENGEFYFIEMNTRLQVEHPVTEAITGIDLVHEQLRVAAQAGLSVRQSDITFEGHAIECRINAEDPRTFMPSPGTITHYHTPGGLGVRVDSGVYAGYKIPPYYDSLIGKLIVHGRNRVECMMRLRRCLDEFVVDGIKSTLPLFQDLVQNHDIANGDYDIHWLEKNLAATDAP